MTCGIYKITRKDTGQMYIGQSKDIEARWNGHIHSPQSKKSYIDRAIRKYGRENFDFQIICELEKDDDLLNAMEEYYIWKYNTYEDKNHFNLTPSGDFSPMKVPEIAAKISGENHYMFGKRLPEETRKKISKTMSGRKLSQKTKNKISEARLGMKLSDKYKINKSKTVNTSEYYHVYKQNRKQCKQGFTWAYRYYEDGKQKMIVSVDIKKLEEKVRAKGLKWLKFD